MFQVENCAQEADWEQNKVKPSLNAAVYVKAVANLS